MSLPWLEAMGPVTNWSLGAPTARPAPNRMAFVYVPNGQNMADWTPKTDGPDFELDDDHEARASLTARPARQGVPAQD